MPCDHVLNWNGVAYRLKALAQAAHILSPAHAPEGRFHRDVQRALCLSLTPEGCIVATPRYTDDTTPHWASLP